MSSLQIPEDFLRGPPQGTTVRRIDFTQTTPPIPAFKNHFAAVIDNVMTESECTELLRLAESSTTPHPQPADSPRHHSPTWERVTINMGGGKQVMSVDTRKGGRIILDSHEIVQRLLDRLRPYLRDLNIETVHNQPLVTGLDAARRGEVWSLTSLNERLRFLRYDGGDYFRPHWDGCYATPDEKESSLFTIHLYLNGDGEQDMAELLPEIERAEKRNWPWTRNGEVDVAETETVDDHGSLLESHGKEGRLLGGATSFMDGYKTKDAVRIFPQTGSVLIFQQRNLLHAGDDVFRGVKYTVRTDVMYTCGTG